MSRSVSTSGMHFRRVGGGGGGSRFYAGFVCLFSWSPQEMTFALAERFDIPSLLFMPPHPPLPNHVRITPHHLQFFAKPRDYYSPGGGGGGRIEGGEEHEKNLFLSHLENTR
jgi:hypothetical protein